MNGLQSKYIVQQLQNVLVAELKRNVKRQINITHEYS